MYTILSKTQSYTPTDDKSLPGKVSYIILLSPDYYALAVTEDVFNSVEVGGFYRIALVPVTANGYSKDDLTQMIVDETANRNK